MLENGLIDQFLMHWQTINRNLRKGVFSEGTTQVTRLQWMLLRHVFRAEDCTVGQIAERFGVRPSTVSQMADRLEKFSLVERVSGKEDARQKVVCLTDKGLELIHNVESVWAERLTQSLSQFTGSEQVQLINLLSRLASSMCDVQKAADHNSEE